MLNTFQTTYEVYNHDKIYGYECWETWDDLEEAFKAIKRYKNSKYYENENLVVVEKSYRIVNENTCTCKATERIITV